MKFSPLLIVAFLSITSAGLTAINAAEPNLVLENDFSLTDLSHMPLAASPAGLQVELKRYPEHNAAEWQLNLEGPIQGEGPRYQNQKSADFNVRFPTSQPPQLHWSKGSHTDATDFQPLLESLKLDQPFVLESFGGRSSDGVMPYFNLASDQGGLIVAIGWSGDWNASFEVKEGNQVRIVAGLKRTNFKLSPGEKLRLPAILAMGYRGSWLEGQNQFRRLLLHAFTPTSHLPMKLMPVAASVHGMIGFNDTTAENLIALASDIGELKLPLDTFWLDAGWNEGGFPGAQGNPQADPVRYPQGLGPVGTAVAKLPLRFLAWFEPERAMRGSWLMRERPAWLSRPSGTPPELNYLEKDGFHQLDLGNKEARNWALDSISPHLREANIAIYRQDFNQYPAYFWHTDEPDDEIGLREIRYINGLYLFLDELVRRHPGLIIDNCASGGRRLDFEMMRRSVVLWRSDSCWDSPSYPRNVQGMTHGLSHWIPLHGLGALGTDDVALRSGMGACASFAANYRDPAAVAALRKHLDKYLQVRPLFIEDYYPLTPWSVDPQQWLAFQFHDSAKGEGLAQAFCGKEAPQRSFLVKLRGLEPQQNYAVENWDSPGKPLIRSGQDLSESGVEVQAAEGAPTAIVLHYQRVIAP